MVAGDKVVTKVEVGAVEEVKALGVVTKADKEAKVAGAAAMVVTKAAMEAATAKLQAVEQPEAWEVVMAVAKAAMVVVVQCDPPEAWEVVEAVAVTDQLPMAVAAAAVVAVAAVDVVAEVATNEIPLRLTMIVLNQFSCTIQYFAGNIQTCCKIQVKITNLIFHLRKENIISVSKISCSFSPQYQN